MITYLLCFPQERNYRTNFKDHQEVRRGGVSPFAAKLFSTEEKTLEYLICLQKYSSKHKYTNHLLHLASQQLLKLEKTWINSTIQKTK